MLDSRKEEIEMPNPTERKIARMDWDELETELRPTSRGAKRSAEQHPCAIFW